MSSTPTREVVALILDVSASMDPEGFGLSKTVCSNLVQQKLIFAPRDEVGLILGGSHNTLNRLHAAVPSRYGNITVATPIAPPSLDVFGTIESCTQEDGSMDMLDALLVAADLIDEKVGDRRYQRRIFLVSDVQQTVKRKEDLSSLIEYMKKREIQLVVIGVGFDEFTSATDNWDTLTPKAQNERVLQFICKELGEGSIVVPVNDAVAALSTLRKRSIAQRAIGRCVLSVGDVRVPVHMFTKTLLARLPSLKKTAEKGVVVEKKYISMANPDAELDPGLRIKAYRYGKSVIPFSEVDEAGMKFESERSLTALGFVPADHIPMHLLLGGVRAVAAAPGDVPGAKALSAFVRAMDELKTAMLVRFVRCTNGDPVLGVCFPSAKTERDLLYFATLPFAEDVRHYEFSAYSEIRPKPEERAAVDQLVVAMTLDADTLKPNVTFNPALQHRYECVKTRFLSTGTDRGEAGGSHVGAPGGIGAAPPPPLPPLHPALLRSSCHFDGASNVLAATFRAAEGAMRRCATLFPFVASDEMEAKRMGKTYWFAQAPSSTAATGKSHAAQGGGEDRSGDATHGAITPPSSSPFAHSHVADSTAATPSSHSATQLQHATRLTAEDGWKVTTADPVGSFQAMLSAPGVDLVDRAIFEMTEVIVKLIRGSIGSQNYHKTNLCVDALRQACVKESEPSAFNKFLVNLLCTVRGTDHELYWTVHCVARGVSPITRDECEESDIADRDEAAAFMAADRAPAARIVDANEDDDLFGQLE